MFSARLARSPQARRRLQWLVVALLAFGPLSFNAASVTATPAADPTVDGLLDPGYTWLARIDPSDPTLYAPGDLFGFEGVDICYWAFVVEPTFNDNVFADSDNPYVSQVGWKTPPGHDFKDLKQSDNAIFNVGYAGGSYSVTLDYLTVAGSTYSSGQTGNDGSAAPGTPPVSAAATSLHWNMEHSGWSDESHAPPFTYNDTPGQYWEWSMVYEFSIPKSAMDGVCGAVTEGGAHNSPSKQNVLGLASLGDYVWKDMNENGLQDDGGPAAGIAGVRLYLTDSSGARIRTSFTTATGYYIFSNLPAGTYTVQLDATTLPAGYFHVPGLESKTSPVTGIALAAGQQRLDFDFGYAKRGSIGDYVWHDADGEGDQDEADYGLAGVRVRLLNGDRTQVLAVATTDAAGYYLFENLLPGDYVVDVNEQDVITLHGLPTLTTHNEPYPYSLAFAEDHRDADFGYWSPEGLVALGDYVWHDFNSNGQQDLPNEGPEYAGVQCISIFLYDEMGVYLGRTDTDSWGIYMFYGLTPGTYTTVVYASDPDLEQINGTLTCGLSDGVPPAAPLSTSRAPLAVYFTTATDLTYTVSPGGVVVLDFDYGISTSPLAVTLASFDAAQQGQVVRVTWETGSEFDNTGFNLYRGASAAGPQTLLAHVPSQAPGSTQGYAYSFDDLDVQPGHTYYYWLEDISLSGATTLHGPVSVVFGGPTAVTLGDLTAANAAGGSALPLAGALLALLLPLTGAAWASRRRP